MAKFGNFCRETSPSRWPLTRGGSPEEVSSHRLSASAGALSSQQKSTASSAALLARVGDTDPPLLVLLAVHHDHLALVEGQLVRVVGHAVVDGFHSLGPLLLRDETHKLGSVGFAEKTSVKQSRVSAHECVQVRRVFLFVQSIFGVGICCRQWSSMRSFLILVYEV